MATSRPPHAPPPMLWLPHSVHDQAYVFSWATMSNLISEKNTEKFSRAQNFSSLFFTFKQGNHCSKKPDLVWFLCACLCFSPQGLLRSHFPPETKFQSLEISWLVQISIRCMCKRGKCGEYGCSVSNTEREAMTKGEWVWGHLSDVGKELLFLISQSSRCSSWAPELAATQLSFCHPQSTGSGWGKL